MPRVAIHKKIDSHVNLSFSHNKVYQIVDWKKLSLIPAYTLLAASLTGNIRSRKELF